MEEQEQERLARTEALFREVNERIAETARRFEARRAEFVCECGDPSCTQRIEASLEEYEAVRGDGVSFLLADGHADERVEATVARRDDHEVVRKDHPRVAAIVRRLDPRAARA